MDITAMPTAIRKNATRRARTPRTPSLVARYFDSLRARVAGGLIAPGMPILLHVDVHAFCDVEYPAQSGRLTPWRTIIAPIHTAACAVPSLLPDDVEIMTAEQARAGNPTCVWGVYVAIRTPAARAIGRA